MRYQERGQDRTNERRLRMGQTDAERLVWWQLRGRKLDGLKFRRQHRIESSIIDFFCTELKLGIELDGDPHFTEWGQEKDRARTERLAELGITILRFENRDIIANPWIITNAVRKFRDSPPSPRR